MDRLGDEELRAIMLRVDAEGFPGDLEKLWEAERVRYRETLRRIPKAASPDSALLDLGSSRPWLPFFRVLLGYKRIVLNTAYPDSGFVTDGLNVKGAEPADVRMSIFDAERDAIPFPNDCFDVVLCLEVLEHLAVDPMAMMAEVNRVLKPAGVFVLSTPNVVSVRALARMMLGEHPMSWSPFNGFDTNRHNREYTPREIQLLFAASGLTPLEITTFNRKTPPWKQAALCGALRALLAPFRGFCKATWRHEVILAVGRKTSAKIHRHPAWLYFNLAERKGEARAVCPSVIHQPSGSRNTTVATRQMIEV